MSWSMNAGRAAPLVSVVLVAACTGGAGGTSTPSPTTALQIDLQVTAAPYRLNAPMQREVAVPDGGVVYLAGGSTRPAAQPRRVRFEALLRPAFRRL